MAPIPIPVTPRRTPINTVSLRAVGGAPPAFPRWLVKRTLIRAGVALLSGKFSAGKSFVANDLALSIVFDRPFLDRKVTPGGVLWIAAEAVGEVDVRVAAARAAKFKDASSGEIPLFVAAPSVGLDSTHNILLWLENAIAEAASECVSFGVDLRLVVIDTLAAFFGLQDENDNAEAAGLMAALARIGNENDLLIMPIAHHGKGDAGVRGASAFGAGADCIISVLADIEQNTGKVSNRSVAQAKIRGGTPGPLGSFEIHSHVLGFDEDGEPVMAGYVEFDTNDKSAPISQLRSRIPSLFFEVFDDVIQRHGQDFSVPDGGPIVRAVSVVEAKNEFMRRHATGNPGNGTDAKRKAWERAFNTAIKESQFAAYAISNGVEMIWRV